MTEQTNPTKTKAPRWMKILLTVSLAFNLLIIGAVSTRVFMSGHYMTGKGPYAALARPGAMHHAGRHMMWKLPRQRRHEMRQLVRMHRSNMQAELKNLANTRLDFARQITSQPDSQAGFDKTYAAVKQAETALHEKASALTKDFITSLTPSERKTYAQTLEHPPRRRWFRKSSRF